MPIGDLFAIVQPTPRVPPAGPTLLRTANLPVDPDARWERGLRWWPEACGDDDIAMATAVCGTSDTTLDAGSEFGSQGTFDYTPMFVQVAQKCSAIGGQYIIDQTRERAVKLLALSQGAGIAHELWRGDTAKAQPLLNDYLANSATYRDVTTGGSLSATNALAELEAGLATCSVAGGNLIHANPHLATLWAQNHLLDRLPDGRLVTYLGTGVIVDPGYDGSDSTGTVAAPAVSSWAYATGPVDVRLGEVQVLDVLNQIRPINDYTVYAFRAFAATFDPCCHLAVKVDHTKLT